MKLFYTLILSNIILFGSLFCNASFANDNKWDVPILTKKERIEKINAYIKPYIYEIYTGEAVKRPYNSSDAEECNLRLSELQNISEKDILEPVYVTQSAKDTQKLELMKGCKEIDIQREYKPSKEDWKSGNKYSYFFEATANAEFYDLSPWLGKGFWSVVSEGGLPHCKDTQNKICTDMIGFESIGKVFNINSCQARTMGMSGSGRYLPHVTQTAQGKKVEYYKTNNFFSFITLANNQLYRLRFRANETQKEVCKNQSDKCPPLHSGARLLLDKVTKTGTEKSLSCIFQSK